MDGKGLVMKKMINTFRSFISGLFLDLLGVACGLLLRQKNVIVFESSCDFADNSWVLYQALRNMGKYHFVWIINDKSRFFDTEDTTFISQEKRWDRIRSIYYFSVAKLAFNTHGTICRKHLRGRPCVVSLWHGTPLKAGTIKKPLNADYMISAGEGTSALQAKFCMFPLEKTIPLGYPRNDLLLQNIADGNDNPFIDERRYSKVVLWMPTFRASTRKELSEDSIDTETGLPLLDIYSKVTLLNNFLAEQNIMLLTKIHWLQARKPIFGQNFSNIKFITDIELRDKELQLYQMVGKSDALLTDYSSVFYDYLLVDKPEGFIVDDMAGYEQSRGFIVKNVLEYMPGAHIYDIDDLKTFLLGLKSGNDESCNDRQRMREVLYGTSIGGACSKIIEYFHL